MIKWANQLRGARRRWITSHSHACAAAVIKEWFLITIEKKNENAKCWLRHAVAKSDAQLSTLRVIHQLPRLDKSVAVATSMVDRALPYKKSCIRADKVEAIRQAGYAAQRAAENNDSKEIFAIVRRLAGVSHKPLESLSRPDGTKLTTVEEAIAHKRTHFTDLFKAKNAEQKKT